MVGKQFKLISETLRNAQLEGFSSDFVATNVLLKTGVKSVDLDDGSTILVVINEGAFMQDNDTTLLSTFQSTEHGVWIDYVALGHGGNQEIIADRYHIPLKIKNELMAFNCRLPTENVLPTCPMVELTGDQP